MGIKCINAFRRDEFNKELYDIYPLAPRYFLRQHNKIKNILGVDLFYLGVFLDQRPETLLGLIKNATPLCCDLMECEECKLTRKRVSKLLDFERCWRELSYSHFKDDRIFTLSRSNLHCIHEGFHYQDLEKYSLFQLLMMDKHQMDKEFLRKVISDCFNLELMEGGTRDDFDSVISDTEGVPHALDEQLSWADGANCIRRIPPFMDFKFETTEDFKKNYLLISVRNEKQGVFIDPICAFKDEYVAVKRGKK